MHTQRPDIRAGLATDPKDAQMPIIVKLEQFALMYRPNSQLSLDGRDQWWSLEQGSGQGLQCSRQLSFASG